MTPFVRPLFSTRVTTDVVHAPLSTYLHSGGLFVWLDTSSVLAAPTREPPGKSGFLCFYCSLFSTCIGSGFLEGSFPLLSPLAEEKGGLR